MITILIQDILLAAVVSIGYGILFNFPKKVFWVAGALGGFGHALRFVLHNHFAVGIILSTLIAAVFIGLLGLWLAHKVHTPPDVFTIPASITMIPGLFAYRTMLGFIKITDETIKDRDPKILADTMHNFVITTSLLFAIAIGITIGALLFRQKSAKHIKFKRRFLN